VTISYSPSTKGFYSSDINYINPIPNDTIAISDELHLELLVGMATYGNAIVVANGVVSLSPVIVSNDALAAKARSKRNQLISQTDWTQAGDVPEAIKTKWAAYRQALRDIPQQAGFPNNITWPTSP